MLNLRQHHLLLQECFDKVAEKDYRVGNLYYRLKDWEAARVYFKDLLEVYPMSSWASQAQFEIADSYARQGKIKEAIEQFNIFIQSYSENELSETAIKRLEALERDFSASSPNDNKKSGVQTEVGEGEDSGPNDLSIIQIAPKNMLKCTTITQTPDNIIHDYYHGIELALDYINNDNIQK